MNASDLERQTTLDTTVKVRDQITFRDVHFGYPSRKVNML